MHKRGAGRRLACAPSCAYLDCPRGTLNGDYGIDLEEVRRVIDAADVLVVRFSVTDRRLIVDARTNETDGPLIKMVPPVASGEERFRALKVMRPRFKTPQRIMTFQWPRHARALVDAGVWEHLTRRVAALGWPDAAAQCEQAFAELLREECIVEREAVQGGEGFKTLWAEDMGGDE